MRSTDEQRIAAAVRTLAEALVVVPPPVQDLINRADDDESSRPGGAGEGGADGTGSVRRLRTGSWTVPLLAAAAVIGVVAASAVVSTATYSAGPAGGPTGAHQVARAEANLPEKLPNMSLLTAKESKYPIGRAAAIYTLGDSFWPRIVHTQQVIVVSADGRSYRRLDEAERRAFRNEGTWTTAPSLLSPDGLRVAVGSDARVGSVAVVDLRTGKTTDYSLARRGSVAPLAWSPDSARLAYTVNTSDPDGNGKPLSLLDVRTGVTAATGRKVTAAAFAPDGSRLAVQDNGNDSASQGTVRVLNTTGTKQVAVVDPGGLANLSANSFSPDGRWLALLSDGSSGVEPDSAVEGTSILFRAADPGSNQHALAPLRNLSGQIDLLGWHSADGLLIFRRQNHEPSMIRSLGMTGQVGDLSTMPTDRLSGSSYDVQLAQPALGVAEATPITSVDRGPWPVWWWAFLGSAGVLACLLLRSKVIRRLWRRIRRREPRSTGPVPAAG